jgi:hypothetical protein
MVMVPCRHHLSSWKSGRSPGIHRPGFFYEQSLMFRVAAWLTAIAASCCLIATRNEYDWSDRYRLSSALIAEEPTTALGARRPLVKHSEQPQQNDDRNRNTDQPQENTAHG